MVRTGSCRLDIRCCYRSYPSVGPWDVDGLSVVDNRAGVTFGVKLYVPWDAPEAVVDVSSAHVVPMRGVPVVIGLVGRHHSVVESRVLQGRYARSMRVLVPDCWGLDQNFHDVTIVDMGICRSRMSPCRK